MSRDDNLTFIRNSQNTTDSWYTPTYIVSALGEFDLDPCTMSVAPTRHARTNFYYDKGHDGLQLEWRGRVWLNPPYSNWVPWLKKLSEHGNGIALISARTETRGFFDHVWDKAQGLFFLKRRIQFLKQDGSKGGAPTLGSVLIAYGDENAHRLLHCSLDGRFVT